MQTWGLVVALLLSWPLSATEGPLYDAIDHVVDQIERDRAQISQLGKKITVSKVTISEDLDPQVRQYVKKQVEGKLSAVGRISVLQCRQCSSARAAIDGDEVVVKRGLTSNEDVKTIVGKLGADSYAEIDLAYTGNKVKLALNTYRTSDQSVNMSRKYQTRALHSGDSGMIFSTTLGQVVGTSRKGYPFAASLFWGERKYGFGSFGLGAFATQKDGEFRNYAAVGPSLALNFNELFDWRWSWGSFLWTSRIHYGWYGKKHRDILLGTGLKMQMWSVYHLAFDFLTSTALKAEESKDDFSESSRGIYKDTNFPTSLMLGFGFDLGVTMMRILFLGLLLSIPGFSKTPSAVEKDGSFIVSVRNKLHHIKIPEKLADDQDVEVRYKLSAEDRRPVVNDMVVRNMDQQDVGSMIVRARSLFKAKKYDEAMAILERAEKLDQNNARIKAMKGSVFYMLGLKKYAKTFWQESLAIDPDQEGIRLFLSKLD